MLVIQYLRMNSQTESDIEEDLNYTPKISSPGNYRKFLEFSRSGSMSDDEAGHSSGNEGFIDDELYRESLPEEGVFVGQSVTEIFLLTTQHFISDSLLFSYNMYCTKGNTCRGVVFSLFSRILLNQKFTTS